MEKLIRGHSSHPNPLTHFHPSHHPPLHLLLSVSHSPSAANELILRHTLCLQLYLFFDSTQCSSAFFIHQKKPRERWFLPYLQLGVFLFMHVSFLPLVFNPLVSPVCWCWSQIVKQAAQSKRRQALWLLLSQSHISLFRLLVHIHACVCGVAHL